MSVFEILSTVVCVFFGASFFRLCLESQNLAESSDGEIQKEAQFKAGCASFLFVACAAWVIAVVGHHLMAWAFP